MILFVCLYQFRGFFLILFFLFFCRIISEAIKRSILNGIFLESYWNLKDKMVSLFVFTRFFMYILQISLHLLANLLADPYNQTLILKFFPFFFFDRVGILSKQSLKVVLLQFLVQIYAITVVT